MRILFLSSRYPFPPVGGDRLRVYHFLRHLVREHTVTLLSFVEHPEEAATPPLQGLHRVVPIHLPRSASYLSCARGLLSRDPLQTHYYRSRRMAAAVADELAGGVDAIVCHLIRMAQYLPETPRPRKIVDLTDAISLNYDRARSHRSGFFALVNRVESGRVRAYEQRTIARADCALLISEVDAGSLEEGVPAGRIRVVKNGVDLERFPFSSEGYDADRLCIVGNFRYFPNVDAARYLIERVFPLVRRQRPAARLFVVGVDPPAEIRRMAQDNGVEVTGFVDDVAPYVRRAAVSVAPMRVGAGVQNKILESLALGTPVVTTRIGAEGLDAAHLSVAVDPEGLAEETLALMENPELRGRRSREGRAYVEREFQWDRVLQVLDESLESAS